MRIQDSLDAIQAILEPVGVSQNFEVVQFSQTQEQRGRAWMKEMLLIHFSGASLGTPSTAQRLSLNQCSPIQQEVTYNIELVFHAKLLRNDRSTIYDALEAILDAISGKRIDDLVGPLYVTGIDFRELQDSKFYLYGINVSFAFKRQAVC